MQITKGVAEKEAQKMRSTERQILLRINKDLKNKGVLSQEIARGDNKLYGVLDRRTMLWSAKMEKGIVPNAFRQRFTSFDDLLKFSTKYFKDRGIEVIGVKD